MGDPHEGNTRMLKSIRDVTEERKIQEKLGYWLHRFLSGLYNRKEFTNLAQKEFALAKNIMRNYLC